MKNKWIACLLSGQKGVKCPVCDTRILLVDSRICTCTLKTLTHCSSGKIKIALRHVQGITIHLTQGDGIHKRNFLLKMNMSDLDDDGCGVFSTKDDDIIINVTLLNVIKTIEISSTKAMSLNIVSVKTTPNPLEHTKSFKEVNISTKSDYTPPEKGYEILSIFNNPEPEKTSHVITGMDFTNPNNEIHIEAYDPKDIQHKQYLLKFKTGSLLEVVGKTSPEYIELTHYHNKTTYLVGMSTGTSGELFVRKGDPDYSQLTITNVKLLRITNSKITTNEGVLTLTE